MRAVVQRVSQATVSVNGIIVGSLSRPGLAVLLGVTHRDTPESADSLAVKLWRLRILDAERSAEDVDAPILIVSQFTLYADTRKGRRPSWSAAAPAHVSEPLYRRVCESLAGLGATVERGVFGEMMQVALVNDGPMTVILEV